VNVSSKPNTGHTEHTAGLAGIIKCVLLGVSAASCPNLHLHHLNPNIDYDGYPVLFVSEFTDQMTSTGFIGVSSFGFGGSNARGDVWTRCLQGPRNTNPTTMPLDLSIDRIRNMTLMFGVNEHAEPDALALANEVGGLVQYDGEFMIGNPCLDVDEFLLEGSFNGWSKGLKMTETSDNKYKCAITLGDSRVEHFRISADGFADAKIFPASEGKQTRIVGPGPAPPGHFFCIDGRKDGTQQGTVYNVLFWYDEKSRQKRVHWEPTFEEESLVSAASVSYKHSYYVVGSWNNFKPLKLQEELGGDPGCFRTTFKIGLTGQEEFNFMRDGQNDQFIYPSQHRALDSDVPVRGPDVIGKKKYFGVTGDTADEVKVQLQVWDGEITVSITTSTEGMRCFRSMHGSEGKRYFAVCNWNKGRSVPFARTQDEAVFTATVVMPYIDYAVFPKGAPFHIAEDDDEQLAFHPEMNGADQGVSCALGPDAFGKGLDWGIVAEFGRTVEILLDMSQKDRRKMVTWAVL